MPRTRKDSAALPAPASPTRPHQAWVESAALSAIIALAALLRLIWLTHSPPGLHQDEASNAWNAYCLLQTGRDQHGAPWPIFYIRAWGDFRSALYLYLMLPFQLLGGLNVWTSRLPSAMFGIATIPLVWYIGRKWFGSSTGLAAAGFVALMPWHILQSRWGLEPSVQPFFISLALTLLLAANLPFAGLPVARPRIWLAAAAGFAAGIGCYGYGSTRIFLPPFLLAASLVTLPGWIQFVKTRRGLIAAGALLVGWCATFGPLACMHIIDSERIGKRSVMTAVWDVDDPLSTKITKAAARYPGHFGLDFLFLKGDQLIMQRPPDGGQLHWYLLPLLLIGVGTALFRVSRSAPARILLVWLLLYPIGDCLSAWPSMHTSRSAPGIVAFALLAALGLSTGAAFLARRSVRLMLVMAGGLGVGVCISMARFCDAYFRHFPLHPEVRRLYHADLVEACKWLKPRFVQYDAIFCTSTGFNMPYSVVLVMLDYSPERWLADDKQMFLRGDWEVYWHFGKVFFLYGDLARPVFDELVGNPSLQRTLFIVRPDEMPQATPVRVIHDPNGRPALWLVERTL